MSNPAIDEYSLPVKRLSDVAFDECISIAILFLNSTAKYSILRQNDSTSIETYFNEGSQLFLEDSSGIVEVTFKSGLLNKLKFFSSGIVLGFVGCKNEKNQFECNDLIFPKPLQCLAASQLSSVATESQRVLFLSNVCINKGNYEKMRFLMMFYSDRVDEIVIFGDLFGDDYSTLDFEDFSSLVSGVKCMVRIVPGKNDPTSKMLPQQPLPRMLFSHELGNIKFLPQPCETRILDRSFVMINKAILEDLMKYRPPEHVIGHASAHEDGVFSPVNLLEQLLKIRHMAPSCPDTLSCVPFDGNDPFIINKCDYLIAAGTSSFAHRVYKGVTLVCIKDFQINSSGVLIDVGTNTLTEVEFSGF